MHAESLVNVSNFPKYFETYNNQLKNNIVIYINLLKDEEINNCSKDPIVYR